MSCSYHPNPVYHLHTFGWFWCWIHSTIPFIWVNDNISPTSIVRPFGDDFPHWLWFQAEGEQGSVVMKFTQIYGIYVWFNSYIMGFMEVSWHVYSDISYCRGYIGYIILLHRFMDAIPNQWVSQPPRGLTALRLKLRMQPQQPCQHLCGALNILLTVTKRMFAPNSGTKLIWLVVYLPLWKIWKSVGIIIPNLWKNKKCSKPPTSNYQTKLQTNGNMRLDESICTICPAKGKQ